jgi:hypothetical protein
MIGAPLCDQALTLILSEEYPTGGDLQDVAREALEAFLPAVAALEEKAGDCSAFDHASEAGRLRHGRYVWATVLTTFIKTGIIRCSGTGRCRDLHLLIAPRDHLASLWPRNETTVGDDLFRGPELGPENARDVCDADRPAQFTWLDIRRFWAG